MKECKITEEGRECSHCGEFKIWDCYYKQKGKKLGYSSWCIKCHTIYNKNGIIEKEDDKKVISGMTKRKFLEERKLNIESWKYQEPTSYELNWKESAIEVGTNPIPILYSLIK